MISNNQDASFECRQIVFSIDAADVDTVTMTQNVSTVFTVPFTVQLLEILHSAPDRICVTSVVWSSAEQQLATELRPAVYFVQFSMHSFDIYHVPAQEQAFASAALGFRRL